MIYNIIFKIVKSCYIFEVELFVEKNLILVSLHGPYFPKVRTFVCLLFFMDALLSELSDSLKRYQTLIEFYISFLSFGFDLYSI